jgi:hypothetical protein
LLHGQVNTYSDGVEGVCFVLLSIFWCLKIYNLSLRGLRKSARRRACALERVWRCFRYEDIDHSLKSEHECTPLRLPRTMAIHGYLSLVTHTYDSLRAQEAARKILLGSKIEVSTRSSFITVLLSILVENKKETMGGAYECLVGDIK